MVVPNFYDKTIDKIKVKKRQETRKKKPKKNQKKNPSITMF